MCARALFVVVLAALQGCGDDGSDGGGGPLGQKGCPGNRNVDSSTAEDLTEGTAATGYLCPVRNQHWYRVQVTDGKPILSVDLHNDTPLSPVTLTYTLRGDDGMTVIDQPPAPMKMSGKQAVRFSHCTPKAGTYFLQVQSFGDDAADTRNPFSLTYAIAPNPDPGEPGNGIAAGATPITDAPVKGFIACKRDRDFYRVDTPNTQSTLLEVSLTTGTPTPDLNLKYTIYQDGDPLAEVAADGVDTGMKATNLRVVRALPNQGTRFYVVVEDQKGAGSDLKTPYTLKVRAFFDPDTNEASVRNDVPAAATDLGNWACGAGMSLPGKIAYLASRADIDWYKLTLAGVSPACPANIDVIADWHGGGAGLQPQVLLVYPDAKSKCDKDEDCRTLGGPGCGDDNNCEYRGNQCNRQAGRCTGAALCLPTQPDKLCGALQFGKQAILGAPAVVHTAQPLREAGVYYIGVRDLTSTNYDYSNAYTFGVHLDPDDTNPDTREPDNFYNPYAVSADLGLSKGRAHKIKLDTDYTGHIAYDRDADFYVFDHPCPGRDCTLSVTYSTTGRSPMYFTYRAQPEDGPGLVAAWPADPMPRQGLYDQVTGAVFGGEGTDTCFYASKRFKGPYYLWVSDSLRGGPKWDPGVGYTFRVHAMDGCSDLCKTKFMCGM